MKSNELYVVLFTTMLKKRQPMGQDCLDIDTFVDIMEYLDALTDKHFRCP